MKPRVIFLALLFSAITGRVFGQVAGYSRSTPINAGTYSSSGNFVNSVNSATGGFTNNYGNAANDVWYSFSITSSSAATVLVSLCGSSFDTYLHLLNSSGTEIANNDDNGPACSGLQSSLSYSNLSPGTYYIDAEGYSNYSGTISLSLSVTAASLPVISYSLPTQKYMVGAPITPLTPTNTGGAIAATNQTLTFAGNGSATSTDGSGTAASFDEPLGMVMDGSGNLYVADAGSNKIRKVTPAGAVTTLAGSGAQGFTNGTGTAASFNHPVGLTLDASGNLYVADEHNNAIRKITPAGVVTTFAGSGSQAYVNGTGTGASFYYPCGVVADNQNNIFVADTYNQCIRKITPAGVVSTFAGSGSTGTADGTGTAASFSQPFGLAIDASNNLYLTDRTNQRIRKITPSGIVTTLAGSTGGYRDGTGTAAQLQGPTSIALDAAGNIYITDETNQRIRKITQSGVVSTIAGTGSTGAVNGIGTAASFYNPFAIAAAPSGYLYIGDQYNYLIRKIIVSPYTISPALPQGLSIDQGTGTVSGTPAVTSVSTYYTVSAYSTNGSGVATLNLSVNPSSYSTFAGDVVTASYSSVDNIVSVNESTGTANVVIPLYTIKTAHINFPINLTYSANGIKATDVEGNAGMGWNVSLGGAVTRQLRGIPDDISVDNAGVAVEGWMHSTVPQNINALNFVNDNNTSTCADENTDISAIQNMMANNTDTEPDVFQVNAPGLSCQLIFDQNNQIRVTPYKDLKVSYTTGAIGSTDQGQITSFSITNDDGVTYLFSTTSATTQKSSTTQSSVNYFQSNYNRYKNGITYYSAWALTSITDTHGNAIVVNYAPGLTSNFNNSVVLSNGGGATTTEYTISGTVTSHNVVSVNCATSVLGQGQDFQVAYETTPQSNRSVITNITGMGHNFIFGYNHATTTNSVSSEFNFTRLFLNNIMDDACAAQNVNGRTIQVNSYTPINYTFNYLNTGNSLSSTTSLASSASGNVDYWGYTNSKTTNTSWVPTIDINPGASGDERYRNRQVLASPTLTYIYSIAGANREADQSSSAGTLSQINYAGGGYTTLSYEPNDYYDNTAHAIVQGGGIRITQILDHDGVSNDQDFIRSYSYRDVSGNSTGLALSLPVFAFTIPYAGTNTGAALWNSSTMVSPYDLSSEDHSILYSYVTETVNNTGSTVYQYAVPATNWDTTAPSSPSWSQASLPNWNPTQINVGRTPGSGGSCQNIGVLRNDINTYPFPPNVNYDFERGLLTNVLKYNNNGVCVSETDYYYQTPESPVDIAALKYDINNYAVNYAKYFIHTGAAPLVSQIVDKVFDLTNVAAGAQPTEGQVVTTNNYYNNAQHKLSQQIIHNSDLSTKTVNIKYIKDYNLTNSGDSYTENLLALQNKNINIPVESYTQYMAPGSSQPLTTHAELTLFGTFANQGIAQLTGGGRLNDVPQPFNIVMNPGPAPLKHLTYNAPYGVTDFAPSAITNTNTFQYDNRYIVTENDLGYDYSGALLSSNNGFSVVKSNLYDNLNAFRLRATINNASYDQIAMDFPKEIFLTIGGPRFHTNNGYGSSPNTYNFSAAANASVSNSSVTRKGQTATLIGANGVLTSSLNKNASAQNYIFSVWLNAAVSGSFTVSMSDGTNNVSKTFNYDATVSNASYPTGFEYCRLLIPVSNLSATSPVTVNFSATTDVSFTDIMTFPDIASVMYYTYDGNQNKISETDGNGVSQYYSYDALNRLAYVYDQDNNIIERKTYINSNPAINSVPLVNLTWSGTGYLDGATSTTGANIITFGGAIQGYNSCNFNGNSVYQWNFGDGTTQTTTALVVSHYYTGRKGQQFTCTLTITSPENSSAPYSISSVVNI